MNSAHDGYYRIPKFYAATQSFGLVVITTTGLDRFVGGCLEREQTSSFTYFVYEDASRGNRQVPSLTSSTRMPQEEPTSSFTYFVYEDASRGADKFLHLL